jgi:excisionase family DNA binding protein
MSADDVMTVDEVAAFLRCHRTTIYRLLKRKQIPAFRIGSDWRFMKAEIVGLVERLTASAGAAL